MKIAVTGATGFLGKYVVDYFCDNLLYKLLVIARPEEYANEVFHRRVNVFESDYSEESLKKAFEGIDIILHLAAQTMSRDTDPLKISAFYDVNILLTENVLLAANYNKVKLVCQMSSNGVYSNFNKLPFTEQDRPQPPTIYGLSKIYSEYLGEYFSSRTGIKVISLRLARLFGYGERPGVVFMKYINQAINKCPLEIWGEGETCIEYMYVKDALTAIEKVITQDIPSGMYNVGVNRSYTVKEIAEIINSVCNNKGNVIFDNTKKEAGYHILMDSSKFNHITGWHSEWKMEDAIKDILRIQQKCII